MSRQFSIPTILRMVPNELLQEFFVILGHSEFDPCWPQLGKRELDPMLDYITDLPASQAAQIDQELQAVYELSCQSGMSAITESAKLHGVGDLPLLMPQEMSVHGRAMWTRLNYPEVFNTAQLLHEVDHLSWWRKRNDLPATEPVVSPETIRQLEHGISCLLKDQGRGRLCTIETYRRGDVHYFFAYPDDYSETAHKHDDAGNLIPVVINKTMQVVFAYDQSAGSLETYAKLPKRMKEGLENCFAACILGGTLSDQSPTKTFEMNQLKDPDFHLQTDPQDCVAAQVVRMRIAHQSNGRKLDVAIDRTNPGESIYRAIQETLQSDVRSHGKSCVITPTRGSALKLSENLTCVVVGLEDVLDWTGNGFQLDDDAINGRFDSFESVTKPTKPKPKRSTRAAAIEALRRELNAHIVAAADHAFDTEARTGTPVLLPKPTQAELAARINISAPTLSRCMEDRSAPELRILWDAADNVYEVMKWRKLAAKNRR